MGLLAAALLGVVQGLTEFLPVSSSGHLILGRALFGWDADRLGLPFDVAVHVGTLLAVVLFFRRDLAAMAAAIPAAVRFAPDADARLTRLIGFGTLPVVVVGLTIADVFESDRVRSVETVAVTLFAGALALLLVERIGSQTRREESLSGFEAVLLGVAQTSALVPGVSRSGATIAVGMLLGLRRESAARFGFLLGVPAILAAAGQQVMDLAEVGLSRDAATLFAVGITTSAITGYATVKYFIRYLVGHSLDPFAYYRLGLAAIVVLWILI
jgi:undecaprenyl-diphosphatase